MMKQKIADVEILYQSCLASLAAVPLADLHWERSRIAAPKEERHRTVWRCRGLARGGSYKWFRTNAKKGDEHVPCSLILAVAPLNDLMFSGQDFLFENLCAAALVYACDLEYLSRVHVGVGATAHDCNAAHHALVDLDAVRVSAMASRPCPVPRTWTEE